jgi:Holliday junction resolvasome RuvABC endonuclease subunit
MCSYSVGYFVHAAAGHAGQLEAPKVLVVHIVRHLLQVLQVRPDEHVAQGHEVAMLHVFNLLQ